MHTYNRPQTADRRPQTADRRPQTADRRPQTADRRPQTADRRPQTADRRPQTADRLNSSSPPEPLAASQSRHRSRSTGAARAAAGPLLALGALLAAPLLGSGSLAHAQTTVLVSNIDQPAYFSGVVIATNSYGQGFTTGPASGGYTLSSVEVAVQSLQGGTASDITVGIYSESSSNPGTLLHTLTTPASLPPVTTFTAPSGTTLAPNTTYYVVISAPGLDDGIQNHLQ